MVVDLDYKITLIFRYIAIAAICISILSFTLFFVIGSDINKNGLLVESFFLLPVGYLFLFISILAYIISSILVYWDNN